MGALYGAKTKLACASWCSRAIRRRAGPGAVPPVYAADAENGRELFARLYAERYGASFRQRLGSGAVKAELVPSAPERRGQSRRRRAALSSRSSRRRRVSLCARGERSLRPGRARGRVGSCPAARHPRPGDGGKERRDLSPGRWHNGPRAQPSPTGPAPAGSTTR